MRTHVDWRSAGKYTYEDFCKKHPSVKLSYADWQKIIYGFNERFRDYILETGERIKLPNGFGEFTVAKKKRKHFFTKDGKEIVNLPIDWKRTKEKGKRVYNFNFHTEGYVFGWNWFRSTAIFKMKRFWYFKPSRTSSRMIAHYLRVDDKYQHLYNEWKN